MYWFDAIATRNFPYAIRHQNAARGDLAKQANLAFTYFKKSGISDLIDPGISLQIFIHSIRSWSFHFDTFM